MTSKIYHDVIGETRVLVTAQRKDNDFYGNPQYRVQVWALSDSDPVQGHLWYPKVPGYRDNKDMYYNIKTYDIDKDIKRFLDKLKSAVAQ